MSFETFAHKGVEEVFLTGRSRRVGAGFHRRMSLLLDALEGARAGTFAMSVSGNWRLTFRFEHGTTGDILDVDFEDYH